MVHLDGIAALGGYAIAVVQSTFGRVEMPLVFRVAQIYTPDQQHTH